MTRSDTQLSILSQEEIRLDRCGSRTALAPCKWHLRHRLSVFRL